MGTKPLFALLVCFALPLRADRYPRQPGIDIQHYAFRITLSDASDEIAGEAAVDLRFVRDGLKAFALDLASPSGGKGMTVLSVKAAGAPLEFLHRSGRLTIKLRAGSKTGELAHFTIAYRGVPAGGLHIGPNRYGERTFFSNNWPDMAHQWLPTIDHPYDKATSEFIVTAPARYRVVSNGVLVEERDLAGGARRTHWKQSVPTAVWLDNIGAAQFEHRAFGSAAGAPLETWVFQQDREKGIGTFETAMRQAIDFFAGRIGPYPYEKLAAVEAVGFPGAMENASAIFFDQRIVSGEPAPAVVAHEVAHQWFGDSVTENDWDDVWLSEGFATYFQMLCSEYYEGPAAFRATLQRTRGEIFALERKLPETAVVQHKPWKGVPNPIVYQKGAWTLHMLRGLIGTEKFWTGIREYYRRFRDGNASTAGFREVMEQASGANLGWFFDQWLLRPGSPSLEASWRYDAAAKKIVVKMAQTQPGKPYRLLVEVGISDENGAQRVQKIEMRERRQRFEIASKAAPAALTFDPNTGLLAKWTGPAVGSSAFRRNQAEPDGLGAGRRFNHPNH